MVFNSLTFLAFFSLVLLLHSLPLSWTFKKSNLLVASYLFYAAWNPPFVILIWISTIIDWFAARWMYQAETQRKKRGFLLLSLCVNLGLLSFFKYGNFFLDSFVNLAQGLGILYHPPQLDIILPVGISFYTFQTLSYTLDIYRGNGRPWPSFLDFALFVTFFPQLVAGPIVRAVDFLPQCSTPRQASRQQLGWGLSLMVIGLFEKVFLADGLMALVADQVYGSASAPNFTEAWTGTLAFSAQIFFDFAGYSTIAIGAALCLGFVLPDNFRFPYAAIGFSDFWRRWHISLSTWLRDYLYIPLGGNRKGTRRTYINLMLTMLIGGLWHGASWRFVVWGGLHGIYLAVERLLRAYWGKKVRWTERWYGQVLLTLLTYYLVCITWVFFRASSFEQAFTLISAMLGFTHPPGLQSLRLIYIATVFGVTLFLLIGHRFMRNRTLESVADRLPWWTKSLALALMLIGVLLAPGDQNAFIYFQF